MADVNHILVIDDEDDVRLSITQTLELEGFDVIAFQDGEVALAQLSPNWPGIVLTDLKMPSVDGLGVLSGVVGIDRDIPVVVITGHGDIPIAVQAMQRGAYDFMEKTSDPEQLVGIVRRALDMRRLVLENRNLRRELDPDSELERLIIGKTSVIQRLRDLIFNLADTDVDVLLVGETGTGKEVAARCLHDFGERSEKPFVALNCGALAESVIESELFGHEVGAFTGASKQRIGKIEYAEGGTLFLDEIESMPPGVQVRLLRVLQERTLERVGGNEPVRVNVRVVAASKIDLREAVNNGAFREDLLYRLQVAQVSLPPLRERIEDVPLLLQHFIILAAERYHRPVLDVGEDKIHELMAQTWPGNVRELRNVADRLVLGLSDPADGGTIVCDDEKGETLNERLACFERATISAALREHQGRIMETAEALGLPRKTLYLRMQKHGLNREDFV